MLKFDKLKLVSPIDEIQILNEDRYTCNFQEGKLYSMKFIQKVPFNLSIELIFPKGEAVIEFTGKVLGKDYPKLISIETIKECIDNINALNVCKISVDTIMNSQVVKCDVTQDIIVKDYQEILQLFKYNLKNHQEFVCQCLPTGSITIEKNVVSSKRKKRMIIYNKEREMNKSNNFKYVENNELNGKFDNVCRFELNLTSKQQIREALNLTDVSLRNVLSSTAHPISSFITEVVAEDPEGVINLGTMKGYCQSLVLKDCDYDLAQVEAKLRKYYQGNFREEKIKPYREMLINLNSTPTSITKKDLLSMLNVSN